MKQLILGRMGLVGSAIFLVLGLLAYAGGKTDPLALKLESVSKELFGTNDAWTIGGAKTKGLFSPESSEDGIPTIPIRNHSAYHSAMVHVKELKALIESESKKRANFDYSSEKYQTLVEVTAKYVEIQRALYLNFVSNVHELGVSPRSDDLDALNLRVDVGVGSQLVMMTELQKRYNIRHVPGDEELSQVELFIPPYDRLQIEVAALSKVKTKVEYQKLIHLMHLRDSLVNRWSIHRVSRTPKPFSSTPTPASSASALQPMKPPVFVAARDGTYVNPPILPLSLIASEGEGRVQPPLIYASFSEDAPGVPSNLRFSKDLGVEDRYEERITSQIDGLKGQLSDLPLAGANEYGKLVQRFYESFQDLKGVHIESEAVVANILHVEETAIEHSAKQIIFESSFPEDDLSTDQIAERIAINAFRVRKAAVLTTLLRRIRIDLATWRGYLEPDENGMVTERAVDQMQDKIRLSPTELARAEAVLDPYFKGIADSWKSKLKKRIEAYYAKALSGGETAAVNARYTEFLNRVLDESIDGVLGVKQVHRYEAAQGKLAEVPDLVAQEVSLKGIPTTRKCVHPSLDITVCNILIHSEALLFGLDAQADLGMTWVTPWNPSQIADLFTKKIALIEKHDPEAWSEIEKISKDQGYLREIAKFFQELNVLHQAAIEARQQEYSNAILKYSRILAKALEKNPELDVRKTEVYAKITTLQNAMAKVGLTPGESVLTESLYQAAAKKVFDDYINLISTPPKEEKALAPAAKPYGFEPPRDVAVRDATYVRPHVIPNLSPYISSGDQRAKRVSDLGKLFSLLGFGEELFSRYRNHPKLLRLFGAPIHFDPVVELMPKPSISVIQKLGSFIKYGNRRGKYSALSEVSRSAGAQKLLAETIMAETYSRVPFLRVQAGDSETALTGLQRVEKFYSFPSGWNQEGARKVFDQLLGIARKNDLNKVEDGFKADPTLPIQSETFKKIFRSQVHNRTAIHASLPSSKAKAVEAWDEKLKKETRTSSEVWSDRMHRIASVLFIASMVFLLWEFLPILIPAVGATIPTASSFFASFSVLGMSGSVIGGLMSGSNLLVQMFFLATVAVQGQVAFFTLPAQLQYQKEIVNSTVGLTRKSQRILAPAERASRENIQVLQEEIRAAKFTTGFMAVLQGVFLPFQIKQICRGFGVSGKVALSRLGQVNPELAQSMKAYSLSQLIEKFGYAKGSRIYFERYTTALLKNKPIPAVNGGAVISQAQELLAGTLSSKMSSSEELIKLMEARMNHLKERLTALREKSRQYFEVSQGAKTKDLGNTLNLFFGKELSFLGFQLKHAQVKLYIRNRVAQAMERGEFSELEFGTEKYLLKAFLLRLKAEQYAVETLYLKNAVDHLKGLEGAAGGIVGTQSVFQGFSRVENVGYLEALLKWGASHPEFEGTPLATMISEARSASRDFKIIVDDISRLTPKEKAIYDAMNGTSDAVVNEDLTLQLNDARPVTPGEDDYFVIPGFTLGLQPQ